MRSTFEVARVSERKNPLQTLLQLARPPPGVRPSEAVLRPNAWRPGAATRERDCWRGHTQSAPQVAASDAVSRRATTRSRRQPPRSSRPHEASQSEAIPSRIRDASRSAGLDCGQNRLGWGHKTRGGSDYASAVISDPPPSEKQPSRALRRGDPAREMTASHCAPVERTRGSRQVLGEEVGTALPRGQERQGSMGGSSDPQLPRHHACRVSVAMKKSPLVASSKSPVLAR